MISKFVALRQRLLEERRAAPTVFQITCQVTTDNKEGRANPEFLEQIEKARKTTLENDAELLLRRRRQAVNRMVAADIIEIDADQSCSRGYFLTPVVWLPPAVRRSGRNECRSLAAIRSRGHGERGGTD